METNLNRNEKILAYMTLAAIAGFAVLFMQVNLKSSTSVSQIDTRMQIDYKMARPEESYSEYSLNGREIDHTYEAVAKKVVAAKAIEQVKSASAKPKTEAQKKAEADKKKVEASQKAAALARSQAAAKKQTAAATAATQAKTASNDKKSETESTEAPAYESLPGGAQAQNRDNSNLVDPNAAKQKNKKTYAQWRDQVFAQPTRETINAFLDAYKKGDINATEVQAMAQDLLDQSNETLKGLGLYTLRAAPSLASLSQLVHVEDKMSASYKTYIEQAYLAYLQPQNVNVLSQALQTKDKTLIAKTLTILNTNLPNVGKTDSRQGRDNGSLGVGLTMSNFTGLLPALSALSTSQDFAALAQQVMAYIQSSNNVAQN